MRLGGGPVGVGKHLGSDVHISFLSFIDIGSKEVVSLIHGDSLPLAHEDEDGDLQSYIIYTTMRKNIIEMICLAYRPRVHINTASPIH